MTLPITIDDFKNFFLREAGLEYQHYPSWVKTVWDKGDICQEGNMYYSSLVDLNHTAPSEPVDPEAEPLWKALTVEFVEGTPYVAGTIVFYNGGYWRAVVDTEISPEEGYDWEVVVPAKEFLNSRVWVAPKAYNEGDKVISVINYRPQVLKSVVGENYTDPAVNPHVPDLPPEYRYWEEVEEDMDGWILDLDIYRAMGEASFKYNDALFPEEKKAMIALYLTMFFLVYDRQMANSGMNGNSAAGPVISRTVGKMSVSYMPSTLFKSNPSYEFYATNEYGKKAYNLMAPYLRGGIRVVAGSNTVD